MWETVRRAALCAAVCVLVAPDCPAASGLRFTPKKVDLSRMQMENVRLRARGVENLFSRLSFAYDVPVGVEVASGDDHLAVYRIDFKKGTLSDLLNRFTAEHDRYAWKIERGVVSIFPRDGYRDHLVKDLLATEISSFSVKEKTSCWAFAQSLVSTPEISRTLELNGITYSAGHIGGFYLQQLGQRFTLELSNASLKSILDTVVKESPAARLWVIKKDSSARTLSLRVSARLEQPANSSEASP